MTASLRVALDENFPLNLIQRIGAIPGVDLRSIYDIDPGFEGLEDWKVIVALHRRDWQVLATSDVRMLNEPRSLMAVEQTAMTLVTIDGLGHNAVRATGALLLELPGVVKKYVEAKPQVFRWHPRDPQPQAPQNFLGLMSNRTGTVRSGTDGPGAPQRHRSPRSSRVDSSPLIGLVRRRQLAATPRMQSSSRGNPSPLAPDRQGSRTSARPR